MYCKYIVAEYCTPEWGYKIKWKVWLLVENVYYLLDLNQFPFSLHLVSSETQ